MQHTHLEQTSSTQEEVKKALKSGPGPFLVSTDLQKSGIGRQGSKWIQFNDALAFSFTLEPNETLTLSPLEIGILLTRFFKPKVLLKWPNDLLNIHKEKVGGILCQLVSDIIVVGIGINLKIPKAHGDFPYPISGIFEDHDSLDPQIKRTLPLEIYNFISKNRMTAQEVRQEFLSHCVHKNQTVSIKNNNDSITGQFIGITKDGAAILVDQNEKTHEILSGSLFI